MAGPRQAQGRRRHGRFGADLKNAVQPPVFGGAYPGYAMVIVLGSESAHSRTMVVNV